MDIRALRYFVAVYQERNFSAAAKACYVSQPSISSAIAQLESMLDTKLFVRHKKGVTPTEAGKEMYPLAKKLVSDATSLKQLFKEKPENNRIILGLMPFIDLDMVSSWMQRLIEHVSGLDLSLVEYSCKSDANLVSECFVTEKDVFLPLWDENYVLISPDNGEYQLEETIYFSELHNLPVIKRTPCELEMVVYSAAAKQHIEFDVKATVDSAEWAIGLVKSGLGIAIVPESSARKHSAIRTHRFIDMDFRRKVGLSYPENKTISDTLQQIIAFCKAATYQAGVMGEHYNDTVDKCAS